MGRKNTLVSAILAATVDCGLKLKENAVQDAIKEASKRNLVVTTKGKPITRGNTRSLLGGIIKDIIKQRPNYWSELEYQEQGKEIKISRGR